MLRAKLSIARELMRFGIEVRAIIYADKELHRRYGYEIHPISLALPFGALSRLGPLIRPSKWQRVSFCHEPEP